MKTVTTYHVYYKLKGIDEWWDWKSMPTAEEAIEEFKANPERYKNAERAVVIKTVTQTAQYIDRELK